MRPIRPVSPIPSPPLGRALVLIDARPLQHAAWSEFHAARKRLDKTATDLRRHEETDSTAYQAWLHGAFPQLVTTLRDLHAKVLSLSREIESVQYMAALTGRSPKKLWKEHKDYLANPEAYDRAHPPEPEPPRDAFKTDTDDLFNHLFGDDEPASSDNFVPTAPPPPATSEARDLYRRLVQHLHPDRGGKWTPARERLWHEVQQAWAARDADWLARLEIDWEAANDTLSPDSSLSRLRRAIAELHAARRDTERKLRDYRRSPAWRFTLSDQKRPQLHRRLEGELHEDLTALQRQFAYLQSTIAAWESPPPSRRRSGAK